MSSRRIALACEQNVQFIAISGDSQPSYTHIAKFVRALGDEIHSMFAQVLMTCDRMGLIDRQTLQWRPMAATRYARRGASCTAMAASAWSTAEAATSARAATAVAGRAGNAPSACGTLRERQ